MSQLRHRKNLDALASRAILVDIEQDGETVYVLPPPMAGFFEFSMMRIRDDVDQKVLGELFYEYMNVEEDFIRELFTQGETQLGRTFVHEPALSNKTRCTCWIMNGQRISLKLPPIAGSGCATAATRWSIWDGTVTRQKTSA